ncbi:hypothetical protein ACFHW2_18460 [Actinomadura sp. LOL_016]
MQQWLSWAIASGTVEEFVKHIGRKASEDEMIRHAQEPAGAQPDQ